MRIDARHFQYSDPPPPKKFCGVCGKKLIERQVLMGYDEYTGEKKVVRRMECPDTSKHLIVQGCGPWCSPEPERQK